MIIRSGRRAQRCGFRRPACRRLRSGGGSECPQARILWFGRLENDFRKFAPEDPRIRNVAFRLLARPFQPARIALLHRAAAQNPAHRVPRYPGSRAMVRIGLPQENAVSESFRSSPPPASSYPSPAERTAARIVDSLSERWVSSASRFPRKWVSFARRSTAENGEDVEGHEIPPPGDSGLQGFQELGPAQGVNSALVTCSEHRRPGFMRRRAMGEIAQPGRKVQPAPAVFGDVDEPFAPRYRP